MWVKWRHGYSSEVGEWKWKWEYLGECSGREKTETYVRNELVPRWEVSGGWFENYRGVKFELVEKAPRDVITGKIKAEEERIERATNNMKLWISLLKEI